MRAKVVCPGLCKFVPMSQYSKTQSKQKKNPSSFIWAARIKAKDYVAYKPHKVTSHDFGSREVPDQSASRCGIW